MTHRLTVLACILVLASLAAAQSTQPAPASMPAKVVAPPPELCKGVVDPYDATAQRNQFLVAAGVDNELDEKEFAADQKKGGNFARKFDRWAEMLKFDKNNNKTLDWFEADAYRQDLRKKVLAMFGDKAGKLVGANRDAANRALDEGNVFGDGTERPRWGARGGDDAAGTAAGAGGPDLGGRGGRWGARANDPEMIKKYDADGDGKLSDAERETAVKEIRADWEKRALEKYDANKDGVLDEDERKAMREDTRRQAQPWQKMMDTWMTKQFDTSGTGELSEEDKTAKKAFERQLQDLGKVWDAKLNDLDGDGTVTQEERQQVQGEWRKMGLKMLGQAVRYMDADGDGKVSPEETAAFQDRLRDGIQGWLDKTTTKYDEDGDGRLSEAERTGLVQGLRDEIDQRAKKFDTDNKGHLTPDEMFKLIQDFGKEIGVTPVKKDADAEDAETK